jgi:tetratricopeptide (TPR) repeat protein
LQKQYQNAEKQLRHAIEINPKWGTAYASMASIYMEQNDLPGAVKAIDQGLQAIPDDPALVLLLASAHERAQDYEKAMEAYERVLRKTPDNAVAANNLASLLVEHKNDRESLERAKTLAMKLEKAPQPVFRDTLGWVYYKTGEIDKAIPVLEGVVKQAPNTPIFNYHLGMAYYKKGELASAKTHLTKATVAKNDYPGLEEAREVLKKIP